jgi:hypothetical protein
MGGVADGQGFPRDADARIVAIMASRKKAKQAAPRGGRAPKELVAIDGREVAISNPAKVLFPEAGYTKLDLVQYYVTVAEGALRGAGGRPNMLVRYPDGVGGEFFYQKRAPQSRPSWIEVVALRFPSGRSAEEVVPRDAAALAVDADAVAQAVAREAQRRGSDVAIVRNGSRGLLWLEPLVEVDTPAGRIAYGPVAAADVPALFDAGWLRGAPHPLRHGPTAEIP